MPKLGVNIDHIATLRELRRSAFPDVASAAKICEAAGADSIVVHLREDRRHIQDADVRILRRRVRTRLNLEMSVAEQIIGLACRLKPDQSTLVPERRRELTTEGGLDVIRMAGRIENAVRRLKKTGIAVSLFIEPDKKHIRLSKEMGADIVELHTGRYALSKNRRAAAANLFRLRDAAFYAHALGLGVNAGHGLDYDNVRPVARIPHLDELNIGYSIVCQAVFIGLGNSVRQMKRLVKVP